MTQQHAPRNASRFLGGTTRGTRRRAADGFDRPHLNNLGLLLAELGPAAVESQLAELARMARRYGVATHAAGAMCDRASPTIVRQRAFAVVSAAVEARSEAPVLAEAS